MPIIGDLHTGALVGRDGSIDWLCLPHFDSGACFAALLGTPGARSLAARAGRLRTAGTTPRPGGTAATPLVLETIFETPTGTVKVIDCMPPRDEIPDVMRRVECVRGTVDMVNEIILRFDYGSQRARGCAVTGHRVPRDLRPGHGDHRRRRAARLRRRDDVVRVRRSGSTEGDAADFRLGWTGPRGKLPGLRRAEGDHRRDRRSSGTTGSGSVIT